MTKKHRGGIDPRFYKGMEESMTTRAVIIDNGYTNDILWDDEEEPLGRTYRFTVVVYDGARRTTRNARTRWGAKRIARHMLEDLQFSAENPAHVVERIEL